MEPRMTIGEFAATTWLSPKALRLYAHKGLLVPEATDPFNGYRQYGQAQVEIARLISLLRRIDMPLDRIHDVLAAPAQERSTLVAEYRAHEAAQHTRRQALAGFVEHVAAGGSLDGEDQPDAVRFEVSMQDVPTQAVLTSVHHTTAQSLPQVIRDAASTLLGLAQERGGVAGPLFVVYHGQVGWDSDGPVEVCLPISATDRAHRKEPAHRQLSTHVPAEDVQFPRILAAFEAVRVHAAHLNLVPIAPPREVYTSHDGRTEVRCDVALPVSDHEPDGKDIHGNHSAH